MSHPLARVLLLVWLMGCATHERWSPPPTDPCVLPASGWLVVPPTLRGQGRGWGTAPTTQQIETLRESLARYAHMYLRDTRGYAVKPAQLESRLALELQEWAWNASPGEPVPKPLLRQALQDGETPGEMLILVQAWFHPRHPAWNYSAIVGIGLPFLFVGEDHHLRLDLYSLPGGEHMRRSHRGWNHMGYAYTPLQVTHDLLTGLPGPGAPCGASLSEPRR